MPESGNFPTSLMTQWLHCMYAGKVSQATPVYVPVQSESPHYSMAARTLHLCVQGEPVMGQRTFFQRFGHHGVCVLPDDVLSDDPLTDPATGEELPSLREQVSLTEGIIHHCFCYARVLRTCGDGLYWADVSATPDLGNAIRVILTEEDLYFALPYDVRVQGKRPSYIRKMMPAHAREVRPVQPTAPDA